MIGWVYSTVVCPGDIIIDEIAYIGRKITGAIVVSVVDVDQSYIRCDIVRAGDTLNIELSKNAMVKIFRGDVV